MRRTLPVLTGLLLFLLSLPMARAGEVSYGAVAELLGPPVQIDRLRALGPDILPHLAAIYGTADETARTDIARTFYRLGWQSPEAYAALMQDIHTGNPQLRLQVQWALGRVSGEDEVVDTLLEIMRHDDNALFRDKAACALAYDQIHLSEAQKVALYSGLIDGLSDPTPQVRSIAIQALQIHTGQTKGYVATASDRERERSIREWRRWLDNYRASL